MAIFEVRKSSEERIELFVRFDREDILKVMYQSCEDYGKANDCLETYLNDHFTLSFDDQALSFVIEDIDHSEDLVEVKLLSKQSIKSFSTIHVFNDALIVQKDSQENIVRFLLDERSRSFRMNKDRLKTIVTY